VNTIKLNIIVNCRRHLLEATYDKGPYFPTLFCNTIFFKVFGILISYSLNDSIYILRPIGCLILIGQHCQVTQVNSIKGYT
jgi:hypothetical protein